MLVVSPPYLIGKVISCSHTLEVSRYLNYVSVLVPASVCFHLNFILI